MCIGLEQSVVAVLVAKGRINTHAIDATVPGWERPEGDPRDWTKFDQEVRAFLSDAENVAIDVAETWDKKLPDGLSVVLMRLYDEDSGLDPDVLGIRPVASSPAWADYAASDLALATGSLAESK